MRVRLPGSAGTLSSDTIDIPKSSAAHSGIVTHLPHDEATIDRDRLAGDVARGIAAQEQDRARDLFRTAFAPHGNVVLQHCLQRFTLALRLHLVCHRSPYQPRANVIDADAARCILKGCAFGEADDAVLCSVIRTTLVASDKAAQRGAVHDGSAALLAHD